MSARPGAPQGVEDLLTEILAELREINAKLGQDRATIAVQAYESGLMDPDELRSRIDAGSRGRGSLL